MFRVIIAALRTTWLWMAGLVAGCSLFPETPPLVGQDAGGGAGSGGAAGLAGGAGIGGVAGLAGSGGVAGADAGDAGCGPPQTVILGASADAYIVTTPPNMPHGSETFLELQAFAPTTGHRSLVRFDLASVPAGASVQSATLKLKLVLNEGASHDVGVHQAMRDWTEGASWTKYDGSNSWANGGEFASVPVDFQVVDDNTAVGTVVEWNVTSDVAGFVSGTLASFGWLLKDENDNALNGELLQFASREAANPVDRPKLEIKYVVCASD